MTEVFLPILGVILSTTTKILGLYFVTRATKLFQRLKSFLRRQNVTISFKQTNIWLNSELYLYKFKMAAPSEGKGCAFWFFFVS